MSIKNYFLKDQQPLRPDNAVAAIVKNSSNDYLLQLRDLVNGIFYPGHWGLFGGGLEKRDLDPKDCIIRELKEELNVSFSRKKIVEFTNFTFDFSFSNRGILSRTYFEIQISQDQIKNIRLGEGSDYGFFNINEILLDKKVVPYDLYALWLHSSKVRFKK
ncbi:MAG: NUDIX domain-containing protein [Pseudomonadota bacterium]|nr:NUDIX domain-containing protein [Pseudomonadota bacterium]|tara:strand:+ start:542 stop:1021 length:480 start_codon:yes stop_codon:yes gene_type:complete